MNLDFPYRTLCGTNPVEAHTIFMMAGRVGAVHRFPISKVTEARTRAGLSQLEIAALMDVSKRTLQEWEQGRKKPSGAARTLLAIAVKHPRVLLEVLEG